LIAEFLPDAGSIATETGLRTDLPALRTAQHGRHADPGLPVLLRLPGLRRDPEPESRRLLRVLFLWNDAMPANAAGQALLYQALRHASMVERVRRREHRPMV